ncbi:ADP-ribose glycohydrolase OARD1-like [Lineus longissimus]|uniref:ADP-ribose glycohydrolase OARD1-like n=1 Tax=Lineus longissimus TaxID=88925 RepID=UPI002B4DD017
MLCSLQICNFFTRSKPQSLFKMAAQVTQARNDGSQSPGSKFTLVEKKGDLFNCDDCESLAHCISADIRMGKGIATLFKSKFGGILELQSQGQKKGGLAVLKRQNRFIYYLITKSKYWEKPTYPDLAASLYAMREHALKEKVTNISMPKIGCGLDKLQWDKVTGILRNTFEDTDMKITVYTL